MEFAFTILASLLFVQSLVALLTCTRFTRYVWRRLAEPREKYVPKTAVILPCKGVEPDFYENIIAYLAQDYRHYELIFVTESKADPAYTRIQQILSESERAAWLITSGEAQDRGQKVHNLCAAIDAFDAIDHKTEVLVFADSDARPGPDWLGELVAPLSDPRIGATTGFRWYLPRGQKNFASLLLSVWNAGALNVLGERSSFAWGGSMALNRDTFEALRIKEQWEQGAVSDDYVLSRVIRNAHLRIKFVPQCLMMSDAQTTWRDMLEFTTRQMIITRVYAPRIWWMSAITNSLFNLTFWGGLIGLVLALFSPQTLLPLLIGIFVMGLLSGAMRGFVASQLLPEEFQSEIKRRWWAYWFLHPVVSLLYLYNLIRSARNRRIVWRGIGYDLQSPSKTLIWQRPITIQKVNEPLPKTSGAAAKSTSLDS